MKSTSRLSNKFRDGLLLLLLWTLLGVFSASQIYIRYAYYSEHAPTWRQAFNVAFSDWYAWGLLSPAILWLAHRYPLARGVGGLRWFAHLSAGLVFSILKMLLELGAFYLAAGVVRQVTLPQLHSNLLTYGAIVGVIYAVNYYRKYRAQEVQASQLAAQLAQARLQALKMQLQPHFLFNTLHAISALVHKDAEAAERMIARLSELLRATLDSAGAQEVSLQQELDLLDRYLEIERTRFPDRLRVEINVTPETLPALVPNLILQPLVENAVRHGIAPRAAAGTITLSAQRAEEQLILIVRDNGPGLAASHGKEGVGLLNTRARLRQLYGEAHTFALENDPAGGAIVRLAFPFHVTAEHEHDEN